jgi:hypothetical protein
MKSYEELNQNKFYKTLASKYILFTEIQISLSLHCKVGHDMVQYTVTRCRLIHDMPWFQSSVGNLL